MNSDEEQGKSSRCVSTTPQPERRSLTLPAAQSHSWRTSPSCHSQLFCSSLPTAVESCFAHFPRSFSHRCIHKKKTGGSDSKPRARPGAVTLKRPPPPRACSRRAARVLARALIHARAHRRNFQCCAPLPEERTAAPPKQKRGVKTGSRKRITHVSRSTGRSWTEDYKPESTSALTRPTSPRKCVMA
ncbi:hypothetical protein SRHO_G00094630 [Serrasalmus rhombeus]